MKRLAEDENAVVGIELIAEVVEVEVAIRAIHVSVRHIDVAVRVRPTKYIGYLPGHRPLTPSTSLRVNPESVEGLSTFRAEYNSETLFP